MGLMMGRRPEWVVADLEPHSSGRMFHYIGDPASSTE